MTTTENSSEAVDTPELDLRLKPAAPAKLKGATAEERATIAGHPGAFTIPFGQIRVSSNIREDELTEIPELAASIRARGLLQPIAVRPYGEDRNGPVFVVETGHRRHAALRALKLKKDDPVPAHLVTAEDTATRLGRQWDENHQRRQLDPLDEANTIRELRDLHGYTVTAAADYLGIDRKTATARGYLLELPEDSQALLRDGHWEIEAAQITGRAIREGAPAGTIKNMTGSARAYCQMQLNSILAEKGQAALQRQLEARGFLVVTNPKNGPAGEGMRTGQGADLNAGTAAKVKALDPEKVRTVKDPDGRPAVYLMRSWDQELHVYALEEVELAGAQTGDLGNGAVTFPDGRLTYQAKDAAEEALREVRNRQVTDWLTSEASNEAGDSQLWPLLMHTLVSRLHHISPAAVGKAMGLEVIYRDERSRHCNREACADAWLRACSPDQARQIVLGLLLTQGAWSMGALDGAPGPDPEEPDDRALNLAMTYRPIIDLVTDLVPGVQQPLGHPELVKVATRAMAKLAESSED